MIKSLEELRKEVGARDAEISSLRATFSRKINSLFRNYINGVTAMLQGQQLSSDDLFTLQNATSVTNDLYRVLEEAGLGDMVVDYLGQFRPVTESALNYFRKLGADTTLSRVDKDQLIAYINYSEGVLRTKFGERLVAPVSSAIFDAAFGNLPLSQLIDDINGTAETINLNPLSTLVEDSYRQYQRAVTIQKGDSLELDIYVYVGPPANDPIISEQCAAIISDAPHGAPGVYYKDEISADMHPALKENPLFAGGHPNCRHDFLAITLEFAKELGFEN